MNEKNEIAGYDIQAVESWISENTQGLTGPFSWTRLEGGHSNLTYALLDAHGSKQLSEGHPSVNCYQRPTIWGVSFRLLAV
jgi:hypothetical protein